MMLKIRKRASQFERLRGHRGLDKMLIRCGSRLSLDARGLRERQLFVGLESAKALGGFLHGRARPTMSHRRRTPVFHVSGDAPHSVHDVTIEVPNDVELGDSENAFASP
jgi:hypothetical protein